MEQGFNMEMDETEIYLYLEETNSLFFIKIYELLDTVPQKIL